MSFIILVSEVLTRKVKVIVYHFGDISSLYFLLSTTFKN